MIIIMYVFGPDEDCIAAMCLHAVRIYNQATLEFICFSSNLLNSIHSILHSSEEHQCDPVQEHSIGLPLYLQVRNRYRL